MNKSEKEKYCEPLLIKHRHLLDIIMSSGKNPLEKPLIDEIGGKGKEDNDGKNPNDNKDLNETKQSIELKESKENQENKGIKEQKEYKEQNEQNKSSSIEF